MWRCGRIGRTAERGFSLLELLVVVSLLGIFIGAVYEVVIVGLRVVNAADEREDINQQLTKALDLLTREASLINNVVSAQDQRLKFDADLDGNGTTENNIEYQVSSGTLQRSYSGATVTLVNNLTSLDFDYTDLNGAAMTTPIPGSDLDNIRVVQISVTATKDNEAISLATAAFLRNNR